MQNEFGDEISGEELDGLTSRIRALPPRLIDELWHSCGYCVVNEKTGDFGEEGKYRALPQKVMNRILKSSDTARSLVKSLLLEIKLLQVKTNLAELEQDFIPVADRERLPVE